MSRTSLLTVGNATPAATAGSVAQRDQYGNASYNEVLVAGQTTGASAARKDYTDTQDAAAIVTARQMPSNVQTAAYTLAATDAAKLVTVTATAAATLTVPPNSSVAFPIGTVVEVAQGGAGQLTVAAGAGVTVNAPDGGLTLRGQYSRARLIKIATDTWLLYGDTSPARICSVTQTVAQTLGALGNQGWLDVTFDVEVTDPANMHVAGAANTRVTVPVKGLYRVGGGVCFLGDARGDRGVRLAINGVSVVYASVVRLNPSTVTHTSVPMRTQLVQLNAGDYLTVQAVQTTTVGLPTYCDPTIGEGSTFTVELVTATP